MPTQRGWLVAATGAAVLLVGVTFGNQPLQQLGFGLVCLVIFAVFVVRRGRFVLTATRSISPLRVRPEQPVEISLTIHNQGRGPAPMLLLEDVIPSGLSGHARYALRGIEPGGQREASTTVTPSRRGRYPVGPLQVSVVDPFALARTSSAAAAVSHLLVHPRIEPLSQAQDEGERRSLSSSALRRLSGAQGEDFYTLREYVDGDDLRKVHWPSTAKRGRYMIRQEETPWHTRATVLLDDGARSYGAADAGGGGRDAFERAVSAAASVLDLYCRGGYSFALATAHGEGIGQGGGRDHFNRGLDLLATLEPVSGARDDSLLVRLEELEGGGALEAALVVVTGSPSAAEAVAVSRCAGRFRHVTVVSFPAHRFGQLGTRSRWDGEQLAMEAARLMGRARVRTIVLGPDESLAAGWSGSAVNRGREEVAWGRNTESV